MCQTLKFSQLFCPFPRFLGAGSAGNFSYGVWLFPATRWQARFILLLHSLPLAQSAKSTSGQCPSVCSKGMLDHRLPTATGIAHGQSTAGHRVNIEFKKESKLIKAEPFLLWFLLNTVRSPDCSVTWITEHDSLQKECCGLSPTANKSQQPHENSSQGAQQWVS